MEFTKLKEIELPAAFDAHVHLRDGEMSQLVTPTIRSGGVNQVYVMVSRHPCTPSMLFSIALNLLL
jgi:dihydroorotase